jgi:hypothetical protein
MSLAFQPARNLIVLLTRTCPLRCQDCNIHPDGPDGPTLSPKILETLFTPSLRQRVKGGVIWSGGEPLSAFPELCLGLDLAHRLGFHGEILTAGAWLKDSETILEALQPYRTRLNLRISLDGPHLRQVPLEDLLRLVELILGSGLKLGFTLRPADPHLTAELDEHRQAVFDRVRALDPDFFRRPHAIHQLPHMPDLPYEASSASGWAPGSGHDAVCSLAEKDRVVAWDGHVYACCGLFFPGDNRGHSLGSITASDAPLEPVHPGNPLLYALLRSLGPARLARSLGLPLPPGQPAATPVCSLCRHLIRHHLPRILAQPRTRLESLLSQADPGCALPAPLIDSPKEHGTIGSPFP